MSHAADRLADRLIARADALVVPSLPDPDELPPDPVAFALACGYELDQWQQDVVTSDAKERILCCSRQSGKSTVTAIEAVREAVYVPGSLSLLLSPSQRQSTELARKVMQAHEAAVRSLSLPARVSESTMKLELDNGSRVIALPGSEGTVRGYSGASLVIVDEASKVPDDLITAITPSMATTDGRMFVLSTPAGRRGFFYEVWFDVEQKGQDWARTMVKAQDCPRISPEFLAKERRRLGEFRYSQEYECEFLDDDTSVFSSELIERALTKFESPFWQAA